MPTIIRRKSIHPWKKNKDNSLIASIYSKSQWRNLRKAYIMEHPLCERCLKVGKVTPAEEVHHIKPISMGVNEMDMRSIAYDPQNLMSLCKECHHIIHQKMKKGNKHE